MSDRKREEEQALREEIMAIAHIASTMQADIARILVKLSLMDQALSSIADGQDLSAALGDVAAGRFLN